MRPNLLRKNKEVLGFSFLGKSGLEVTEWEIGHIFSILKVSFTAFTSIEDHKRLDVTGFQLREELMEQFGESIVISPVLLVQKVVKIEAEVEAAAVNNQPTVPEPHILEDMFVLLHEGGQALDSHEASESVEIQHWVTLPHCCAERN